MTLEVEVVSCQTVTCAAVASLSLLMLTACTSYPDREVDDDASVQIPNPAAVFCADQGGTFDLTSGTCTLANGTVVDAWEYFRRESGGESGGQARDIADPT